MKSKNKFNFILLSYWKTALPWFVKYLKSKKIKKIAFVMNAAKRHVLQDKNYVLNDQIALEKAGFVVDVIDLDTEPSLKEKLSSADLIYVRGGNCFDLLASARKSGFDRLLTEYLGNGKPYAGSSAGPILLGPGLEIVENDFMFDENLVGIKDKKGLGLIDFAVFPHYLDEYKDRLDKLLIEKNIEYPVYRLKDNEVILVNGQKTERVIL